MANSKDSLISSMKLQAIELAEAKISKMAEEDPVIFARYYLGFKPDIWQSEFLRSRSPRIILNCSRQSGKSTSTAILALWEAIHKPKSTIVLDSPSLRQSQELMLKFSEFVDMVDKSVKLDSDTKLSVRFANGSRVLALPGSEKTIRGISAVTLLVLDEAAGIPSDLYGAVRPMLAVSKGRLVLMSTPRGEQGFFYETWTKSTGWEKVEVPWDKCPRIDPSFIEEEKRERGSAWVAQEYECKFIAAGSTRIQRSWLKYEDHVPSNLTISLGVDLAISTKETADYTAGAVLGRDADGNLHVLDMQRIRGSFSEQINFIKQLAARWKPTIIGIEDVAYQKALIQQLAAQTSLNVRGIKPINDKVSRFAPMEARYELGQVYHSRDLPQAFESELLSFPVADHDDFVDALAYAFHAMGNVSDKSEWIPPSTGAVSEPCYSGIY
ncbi:phage terminase large subunit [Candidatus Pacearchaeota archaeon]|nr:phage terminase large subunit [Candidatus Pacearchaeota archaeon]